MTLLTATLGVLSTRSAWAAPFELAWSAPPGCPSREAMVALTRERLGEDEASAPPELFVRGSVTPEGRGLVVDLDVKDVDGLEVGERRVRFESRSCESIAEPVALVLATMIAVARPREREQPTSAPQHGDVPPPTPAAEAPPAGGRERPSPRRPTPPSSSRHVATSIGLSPVASFGLLPHVGLGGALRFTVLVPSKIPVMFGGEVSFESSPPAHAAGGEVTFRYSDVGGLAGVRVVRSSWLELVPLVEGRAGVIVPSSSGFPWDYDAVRFSGGVGAGVLGRASLGRALRLDVMPSLRVPITRDEFRVHEGEELVRVHRPLAVGARLAVGIAYELP